MIDINKIKKSSEKGFTLIELLVVVAIIAILALIVLLALNPVEMARRSRDSRRLSDLGTLRRAIDLSLADGEALPVLIAGGITVNSTTDVTNFGGAGMDIGKYISVVPADPVNDGSADTIQVTTGVCPDGTAQVAKSAMVYNFRSDGDIYVLSARLESTDNCGVPSGDGNNDGFYQIGTDPGLNLP